MFIDDSGALRLSATDLVVFLACCHGIALEMGVAAGKFARPYNQDPRLEALFRRGLDHEAAFVATLKNGGASSILELGDVKDRVEAVETTIAAMRSGADVIVQAALGNQRWYGRPDVLKKIAGGSAFGPWSYEVVDTKLARETQAGSILQLALYCDMLEAVQGTRPGFFWVVTPDSELRYRLDDYAAYFRLVRSRLDLAASVDDDILAAENYPEPVDRCDVCAWSGRCDQRRRADDQLSLVAGITRIQRRELASNGVTTVKSLARMPIRPLPFRPRHGAAEAYERSREQGRVQVEARSSGMVFELLPVVPGQGLCRLPEPSSRDLFLDLEGDPFAGPISGPPVLRGREYLLGVASIAANGAPVYDGVWAETAEAEKLAFEAVIDRITAAKTADPLMHVYHYAPYEPSAFKRLMGRHVTREREVDALLRSETFVDLYAVMRQGLRAGVERYSIKNLEQFYGFTRDVDLRQARVNLQAMELAIELGKTAELLPEVRAAVEGYNRDDCISTLRLRDWLESLRADLLEGRRTPVGQEGAIDIPRPQVKPGEPSAPLNERELRVEVLRARLLSVEDPARLLLAYLLDWHRREAKATWWEYFRLLSLSEEDLLDEPGAVSGLEYDGDLRKEKKSTVQRYRFPPQEMELRRGQKLTVNDEKAWGETVSVDRLAGTIDVLVGPSKIGLRPTSAFAHEHVNANVLEDAIFAVGEGIAAGAGDPLALELLYRRPPSTRDVTKLRDGVLAIQGPPGTGKTYSGAKMVCDLVAAGKKVGIAATTHKVIRNLLDAIAVEAAERKASVALAQKPGTDDSNDSNGESSAAIQMVLSNEEALALITSGSADVLGGTAWLWARPEFRKCVDVLFIDEAGQMSLANAVAMTGAARGLVLLGDPQQLDQPKKGSHPEGVDVSALEHILGGAQTMPEELGVFLRDTWRLGSAICEFTSEVFYEGRLRPTAKKDLERQRLAEGPIEGAGLFVLDVAHESNRNGSDEEVQAVVGLIAKLLTTGSTWIDDQGTAHRVSPGDVPSRFALQRAGEPPRRGGAPRCALRDGGQVPGATGANQHLLDGHLEARRRATRPGVPLQPEPTERRDFAGEVRGHRCRVPSVVRA